MLAIDLIAVCTDDLIYDGVTVGKRGITYDLLSIGRQSVIVRGENGMETILNEQDLRAHFLVSTREEGE